MSPRPLASEPTVRTDSPYLTAKEAADYLRFASVRALYKAVTRHEMPVRYRGATLLFHRDELDRWLAGARASELRRQARHGEKVTTFPATAKGDAR